MKSSLLQDKNDIIGMRDLRQRLGTKATIVDFEEQILLTSIRNNTRIWKEDNHIVGFAFVDEYCNLWFETEKDFSSLDQLEDEIIEWGVVCLKNYNNTTETSNTLDHTCDTDDYHRINLLNKHGFVQQQFRSLQYMRDLNEPIIEYPLPSGFWIRSMKGKEEIEELVALHRSAFDTDNMTIEYRLAMMNSPQYIQELDLVAIAPDGKFAAFCVCGFDDKDKDIGYIDPIGTHPSYQKIGLGKAITSAGLMILKNRGAKKVKLGTSNENMAMQRLAKNLSFVCISEKLWFSKSV